MFHVEALNDHIKVEPFITMAHWSGQSADIVTSEELGGGGGVGTKVSVCDCMTPH